MSESVVSDICVDEVEDHGRGSMSFLSDPFVDEVEGYIGVPRFCIVVVSNVCVDEVEDLVSLPGHEELPFHRDENTMLNYNQRDGSYICLSSAGIN